MRTEDFWAYVVDAVEHLEQRSYYQILGVPDDADHDTIYHAYYALVRRLHPDRHIKESAGRQRMLTRVYARMNEAYQVLSKADSRRMYDGLLAHGHMRLTRADRAAESKGGQGPDPRTAKVQAMYDKGRQLLAGGDARGARAQWQLAAQFEPDSKVLAAALASLDGAEESRDAPGPDMGASAQASPGDDAQLGREALAGGRYEEACQHFERALAAQPRDRTLRALWYAALAHRAKESGQLRVAALHRQTALAFDPRCDAAR